MKLSLLLKHVVFTMLIFQLVYGQTTTGNEKNIKSKGGETGITTNDYYSDSIETIDLGKFRLDINRKGDIGANSYSMEAGGFYDNKYILYSSGFFISGKANDSLWCASNAYIFRMDDFLPGKINENYNSPDNKIYLVKKTDPEFGTSWQNWKKAVERGAEFHDGNNDGIYDPVDLNNNNQWDYSEDMPDILGGVTAYTTYNDGVAPLYRRFNNMHPKGIQIKQTVFGYGPVADVFNLEEIVFVKYSIINTGTVNNLIDSVYFSLFGDGDIGDFDDDFMGTDTNFNATYIYNNGPDDTFLVSPPAIGFQLLQGPAVFIPGVTFIDQNNNGTFEAGIDISLMTAKQFIKRGKIDTIYGAMNLNMTSSNQTIFDPWGGGTPENVEQVRNIQAGQRRLGSFVNPCTWDRGLVVGGVNCEQVNPKYFYSGSPVENIGWLNIDEDDQSVYNNTGPFKLEAGKPVEIMYAYVTARGSSAINSIQELKSNFQQAQIFYNLYFPIMGVEDESYTPETFKLEQNYPNPFNPETKIRFQLNKTEVVKLSVFNVLGQEIKTLVNEELNSGVHEVTFNGNDLASGLYFYQLKTSENSSIKKMVLIK